MILWCRFPQEVYSNGRDFSIQDINAQMATSNLIMRCNLTNTIESDTYFKTASGDKTYTLVMDIIAVEMFGLCHK